MGYVSILNDYHKVVVTRDHPPKKLPQRLPMAAERLKYTRRKAGGRQD